MKFYKYINISKKKYFNVILVFLLLIYIPITYSETAKFKSESSENEKTITDRNRLIILHDWGTFLGNHNKKIKKYYLKVAPASISTDDTTSFKDPCKISNDLPVCIK